MKGEAFDVIRTLRLTDSNFKVAWDILTTRYENKRQLVHDHIQTLISLPQINSESAAALSALRDKATVAIKALKHLERAVDKWDDILVFLLVQKFDKATRKAWELQLGDSDEYLIFERLAQFLASRIRALENILPVSKGKVTPSLAAQNHVASASAVKCPICQKPYSLFLCSDFRNKAITKRRELAQKFRYCFNCLSTKHTRKAC